MPPTLVAQLTTAANAVSSNPRKSPVYNGTSFQDTLDDVRQLQQPAVNSAASASSARPDSRASDKAGELEKTKQSTQSTRSDKSNKSSRRRPETQRSEDQAQTTDASARSKKCDDTPDPTEITDGQPSDLLAESDQSSDVDKTAEPQQADQEAAAMGLALVVGGMQPGQTSPLPAEAAAMEQGQATNTALSAAGAAPLGAQIADGKAIDDDSGAATDENKLAKTDGETASKNKSAEAGKIDLAKLAELSKSGQTTTPTAVAGSAVAHHATVATPAASAGQQSASTENPQAIGAISEATGEGMAGQPGAGEGEPSADLAAGHSAAGRAGDRQSASNINDIFARELDQALEAASKPNGGDSATADVKMPVGNNHLSTKADAPSPLRSFVQENHENIVSAVRTQLLPNGGTMRIRLSPGDLGQMQINVRVTDGMLSASFQTSSDDAARLLSHSLSQLKTALESQGVNIDRIHVDSTLRPAPSSQNEGGGSQQQDQSWRQQQQETMHQQQQRRHLLNRMWQRMAGGGDPLDLVA